MGTPPTDPQRKPLSPHAAATWAQYQALYVLRCIWTNSAILLVAALVVLTAVSWTSRGAQSWWIIQVFTSDPVTPTTAKPPDTRLIDPEATTDDDAQAQSENLPLLKSGPDRRRLSFDELVKTSPTIAERIAILRDRVKDLKLEHAENAEKAFVRHTWSVCVVTLILLSSFLSWPNGPKPAPEPATSVTPQSVTGQIAAVGGALATTVISRLVVIAALFLAASQAFGFHSQFQSMFAASKYLGALQIRIDTEIVSFVHRQPDPTKLDIAATRELSFMVGKWLAAYEKINDDFIKSYNNSFNGFQIPATIGG